MSSSHVNRADSVDLKHNNARTVASRLKKTQMLKTPVLIAQRSALRKHSQPSNVQGVNLNESRVNLVSDQRNIQSFSRQSE